MFAFHVKIVEARGLPKMDTDGQSEPYCEIRLTNSIAQKTSVATKNQTDPKWNSTFSFQTTLSNEELLINVLDQDLSKDDLIGYIKFPIRVISFNVVHDQFFTLIPGPRVKESGKIRLLLHLTNPDSPPFEGLKPEYKKTNLQFTMVEADGIPNMDIGGKADPYCKIQFSGCRETFKTKISKNTYSPKWNDSFQINLPSYNVDMMIDLIDDDVAYDDPIGKLIIPLSIFEKEKEHDAWFYPIPYRGIKTAGRIHIQLLLK
jgi:Ca2+-dependent lipid-binding protein